MSVTIGPQSSGTTLRRVATKLYSISNVQGCRCGPMKPPQRQGGNGEGELVPPATEACPALVFEEGFIGESAGYVIANGQAAMPLVMSYFFVTRVWRCSNNVPRYIVLP